MLWVSLGASSARIFKSCGVLFFFFLTAKDIIIVIVCDFHCELDSPPTSEAHKHAITLQSYHSTPQQCCMPRGVFTVDPVHADHAVLDLSCIKRS